MNNSDPSITCILTPNTPFDSIRHAGQVVGPVFGQAGTIMHNPRGYFVFGSGLWVGYLSDRKQAERAFKLALRFRAP